MVPTRILLPLLLAALTIGCGQKGPLYLPEPAVEEPAGAPAPDVEEIAPSGLVPAGEPIGVPGGEAAADPDALAPEGELEEEPGEGSVRDEL